MADSKVIRAGAAYVELFADDSALQKGLKAAESSVKGFGVSVGKIGAAIGGLGALITAPLIAATNLFAESGAALVHMSERTGASVESLSALGFAAKMTGTDLESVEIGIKRMQKALTAGSEEQIAAIGTFNALGLSIQKLMKLKPDQQFDIIARRIGAVKDPTARAGIALQLFGRSGTALLPMIEHMAELTGEAKLGLVTSTEAAQGALKLEQSMIKLDIITKKIFTTIGSALAPMFESWNKQLAKVEKSVLDLVKANKPLIVTIAQVGFALVAAGTAITTLGVAIFGLGQIIGAVSAVIGVIYSALLLLTTPLGLIAVGFVATTTAMGAWGQAGALAANTMKTTFGGMLQTAQDTFSGISDAIKAGDIALAAKVLWAGLNLEFVKGSRLVSKIWSDFTEGLSKEWTVTNIDLASGLTDLWAAIQTGAVHVAFGISDVFENVFHNLGIGWARLLAMIGVGTHEAVQKLIEERDKQAEESRAGKQETIGKIEEGRAGTQGVLTADLEADAAERRKVDRAKIDAAEKELEDAQAALDRLRGQAKKKADEPEAFGEGGQGGKGLGGGPLTPEGLDKGLKEAASKVDVTGTFSAAAAAGQGIGQSIEKEHLDESKKQTAELEKIKKNTAAKQVFAT